MKYLSQSKSMYYVSLFLKFIFLTSCLDIRWGTTGRTGFWLREHLLGWGTSVEAVGSWGGGPEGTHHWPHSLWLPLHQRESFDCWCWQVWPLTQFSVCFLANGPVDKSIPLVREDIVFFRTNKQLPCLSSLGPLRAFWADTAPSKGTRLCLGSGALVAEVPGLRQKQLTQTLMVKKPAELNLASDQTLCWRSFVQQPQMSGLADLLRERHGRRNKSTGEVLTKKF